MKKSIIIFWIFFYTFYIFSDENSISWDVQKNIESIIFLKKNLELHYSNNRPLYYTIESNHYKVDNLTDLFLSFDSQQENTMMSKYSVIYKKYHISQNKSVYQNSAYFVDTDERIELIGNSNSLFQSGINLPSFTISFWVYPVSLSYNEIILKIGSQYYNKADDMITNQNILAKIQEGRVIWEFNNILYTKKSKKDKLILESYSRIIPEKWSHLVLTYNAYSGIIKEYINGIEEGIVIATEDGTLNSTVYNLQYHSTNRCIIVIAPSFRGAIDEFAIINDIQKVCCNAYNQTESELISKVYDFGEGKGNIFDVIFDDENINHSDIIYYYRASNDPFDENEIYSPEIKWNFLIVKNLSNQWIRYFQWKAVFLPGDNNDYSSKFRKLTLNYIQNELPNIPSGLKAIIDNKKISLKWSMNSEKDIKGYKIYYGTRTGNYFGMEAKEGKSPIDIGLRNEYELNIEKNTQIYYIAVTAYDDFQHMHESPFSNEIAVRPYVER